jgi:beta-mannosidase
MFGNEWRTANIPSNIHLDLLTHGLISDPFNQTADNNLTWLETAKVIYRSDFTLSAQMEGAPNQELVFDGIDTEADVYLNG